eukprot:TRINITY_DN63082_c0_g1_i1.p1 TRINITY_DN63082_c0_g1~~TRINITY_DN63082_c0_g1_i1.p1  ORF type:complete len:659 (-),score=346.39 TRINITY_DN63082_c0_g1_i1:1707-3596(-)
MYKPTWAGKRRQCWNEKGFFTIICLVAFVQGGNYLSKLATNYYFKDDLHLSPAQVSFASGIIIVPWVIKPVYGFISDSFPIFELRRTPYFFLFGLFGFICWETLAYAVHSMSGALATLVGASLALAFVNVLAEALIVERGAQVKGNSEDTKQMISFLMTVYWGVESTAKIISGFTSGYLLERISKRTIFAITGFFPALLCLVSFFLREKKTKAAATTIGKQWSTLYTHVQKPTIWKPALFMFVWQATPSAGSAYFFFLTNDIGLKPEFMGTLHLVEGLSSVIALTLYHMYLKSVPYRRILVWTIVLGFIAGATPLILVLHLNRKIGMDDHWFAIADSALLAGVGQVAIMPLLILGAQTCPKQVEGTLYALLMSTLNVGGVVSDQLGGVLTWALGVKENNFDRLWLLVVLCNLSGLLPIPLLNLIPKDDELEGNRGRVVPANKDDDNGDDRINHKNNNNNDNGAPHLDGPSLEDDDDDDDAGGDGDDWEDNVAFERWDRPGLHWELRGWPQQPVAVDHVLIEAVAELLRLLQLEDFDPEQHPGMTADEIQFLQSVQVHCWFFSDACSLMDAIELRFRAHVRSLSEPTRLDNKLLDRLFPPRGLIDKFSSLKSSRSDRTSLTHQVLSNKFG